MNADQENGVLFTDSLLAQWREMFESLPDDDPHKLPLRKERKRRKAKFLELVSIPFGQHRLF